MASLARHAPAKNRGSTRAIALSGRRLVGGQEKGLRLPSVRGAVKQRNLGVSWAVDGGSPRSLYGQAGLCLPAGPPVSLTVNCVESGPRIEPLG